jgi:hypothetical protein
LTSPRAQAVIAGLAAAALAIGGFQTGRYTVDVAAVANGTTSIPSQSASDPASHREKLLERVQDKITVRDIATVPFSELYDVLKSASREQLLAWARDLEQMPRGPRQRAAVTAYYKSLVQVDHRAAIEAVLHAKNLLARDVAIDGMMKAAPESIWADLAEMIVQLPYWGGGYAQDNLIPNWSRVDPVAASRFVEKYPSRIDITFYEPSRVVSLLNNWGEIDPSAAKKWLEQDPSRQTADAFLAFLTSWGRVDRAAAIDYAIANQQRPNFEAATNELVYDFVRSAKEDATKLILLLPPAAAKAAMKHVAEITNPPVIDPNIDNPPNYQRSPEEVARWLVTLPGDLWEESLGRVVQGWLREDADSEKAWFAQLPPEIRNRAIVGMCREAKPHNIATDAVIQLAFAIADQSVRDTALREFAHSFSADKTETSDAINNLPISDVQKAYLGRLIAEKADDR